MSAFEVVHSESAPEVQPFDFQKLCTLSMLQLFCHPSLFQRLCILPLLQKFCFPSLLLRSCILNLLQKSSYLTRFQKYCTLSLFQWFYCFGSPSLPSRSHAPHQRSCTVLLLEKSCIQSLLLRSCTLIQLTRSGTQIWLLRSSTLILPLYSLPAAQPIVRGFLLSSLTLLTLPLLSSLTPRTL